MKENGFEYVDLDLPSGTMLATCNVGATKPEDSGLLFPSGYTNVGRSLRSRAFSVRGVFKK